MTLDKFSEGGVSNHKRRKSFKKTYVSNFKNKMENLIAKYVRKISENEESIHSLS